MKTSIANRILFKNPEHQAFFDVNGYVVVDFLNDNETKAAIAAFVSLLAYKILFFVFGFNKNYGAAGSVTSIRHGGALQYSGLLLVLT